MLAAEGQSRCLPRLRSELTLLRGAPAVTGEPTWLIYDPLQHRYIQIDFATYRILSLWLCCNTMDELFALAEREGHVFIDGPGIEGLIEFLTRNNLVDLQKSGDWKGLLKERKREARSLLTWLAHNYLFFRVPLFQPQEMLQRTLPLARIIGSEPFRYFIVLLGLAGLYLTSRQSEEFVSTFQHVFTWEGAIVTATALVLVKVAHELGHAYSAVHFGCRVPTMGVAFMLMAPLLYTDVTDAWRLRERRQRLIIASAGIMVELCVAAVALFVWVFLPEGSLRSVAFTLAAVSLATSLVINLNPCMRFDGYYLLSDWLGIENLQSRSFELARWKLREILFELGVPCPEQLNPKLLNFLLVYALGVWIYRLALFVGIALLVYYYFFKLLGITLFLFEIGFFIMRPVWSEFRIWYKLRHAIIESRRTLISLVALLGVVLACVVPWSTSVEIPSVLEPKQLAKVFPARSGRISSVHVSRGQIVKEGQALVTFVSPDIQKEIDVTRTKLRLAQMQHARRLADAVDREASLELESRIASLISRINGLRKEQGELVTRAPIAGRIVELNGHLNLGRWSSSKEMIALIADGQELIARGYVPEADLWRINNGSKGVFIPESPQRSAVNLEISEISIGGASQIEIMELASTHGGRIAVNDMGKGRFVPLLGHYAVRMSVARDVQAPELINRGVAIVNGRPESLVARLWRHTITVLLRESGF